MYLMYIDESGDAGLVSQRSPTTHFILSGVVVHESKWKDILGAYDSFRTYIKSTYRINKRVELHASPLISSRHENWKHLNQWERIQVYRDFIAFIGRQHDLRILSVCVNKSLHSSTDAIFTHAWTNLVQRLENTIANNNFQKGFNHVNTSCRESVLILPDLSTPKVIDRIVRKMKAVNFIPSRYGPGYTNKPLVHIIEDPFHKDSSQSAFLQMADFVAYSVKSTTTPSGAIKKFGMQRLYNRQLLSIAITAISPSRDGIKHI